MNFLILDGVKKKKNSEIPHWDIFYFECARFCIDILYTPNPVLSSFEIYTVYTPFVFLRATFRNRDVF